LLTARDLSGSAGGKPRQANLRRAVSSTYYAMFHALARSCADMVVGGRGATRNDHAWRQVYRSLDHAAVKRACKNHQLMSRFPKEIEDFGNKFVEMQIKRHQADYDPAVRLNRSSVVQEIQDVEVVLRSLETCSTADRKAFAAHVLLRARGD
jgi:uncharacterized protein (UPF0332 family)